MELRKRQNTSLSSSGNSGNSRSNSPESSGAKIDRNFTRCIILAFLVLTTGLLIPISLGHTDQVLNFLGFDHKVHAVVIDAGSTGSRVLAFTFKKDFISNELMLQDELWKQVKPGLSSFAQDPVKAGESIQELLDAAKERIPEKYWSQTPITLKATAGLRLLPKDQSEAIIAQVRTVLEKSGFKPDKNNLIEIMNPMEEGLYAWFTVNYLLGSFAPNKEVWTSAASLDLGGGSTQITFAPKTFPVAGTEGRKHFIHQVDILEGQPLDVYSHSYLGLGLMAAREAIFKKSLKSTCITSSNPLKFNFHGQEYEVSKGDKAGFDACLGTVQAVIKDNDVHKPAEILARRDIVAFSYFYDLAVEAGLISGFQGQVLLEDYKKAASKACLSSEKSYACLDLSFVYGLLSDGYGLPDSKQIKLYKKINGHEASWALGVAYHNIHHQ